MSLWVGRWHRLLKVWLCRETRRKRQIEEIKSSKTDVYVTSRTEMTPCLSKYRTTKTVDKRETLHEWTVKAVYLARSERHIRVFCSHSVFYSCVVPHTSATHITDIRYPGTYSYMTHFNNRFCWKFPSMKRNISSPTFIVIIQSWFVL